MAPLSPSSHPSLCARICICISLFDLDQIKKISHRRWFTIHSTFNYFWIFHFTSSIWIQCQVKCYYINSNDFNEFEFNFFVFVFLSKFMGKTSDARVARTPRFARGKQQPRDPSMARNVNLLLTLFDQQFTPSNSVRPRTRSNIFTKNSENSQIFPADASATPVDPKKLFNIFPGPNRSEVKLMNFWHFVMKTTLRLPWPRDGADGKISKFV